MSFSTASTRMSEAPIEVLIRILEYTDSYTVTSAVQCNARWASACYSSLDLLDCRCTTDCVSVRYRSKKKFDEYRQKLYLIHSTISTRIPCIKPAPLSTLDEIYIYDLRPSGRYGSYTGIPYHKNRDINISALKKAPFLEMSLSHGLGNNAAPQQTHIVSRASSTKKELYFNTVWKNDNNYKILYEKPLSHDSIYAPRGIDTRFAKRTRTTPPTDETLNPETSVEQRPTLLDIDISRYSVSFIQCGTYAHHFINKITWNDYINCLLSEYPNTETIVFPPLKMNKSQIIKSFNARQNNLSNIPRNEPSLFDAGSIVQQEQQEPIISESPATSIKDTYYSKLYSPLFSQAIPLTKCPREVRFKIELANDTEVHEKEYSDAFLPSILELLQICIMIEKWASSSEELANTKIVIEFRSGFCIDFYEYVECLEIDNFLKGTFDITKAYDYIEFSDAIFRHWEYVILLATQQYQTQHPLKLCEYSRLLATRPSRHKNIHYDLLIETRHLDSPTGCVNSTIRTKFIRNQSESKIYSHAVNVSTPRSFDCIRPYSHLTFSSVKFIIECGSNDQTQNNWIRTTIDEITNPSFWVMTAIKSLPANQYIEIELNFVGVEVYCFSSIELVLNQKGSNRVNQLFPNRSRPINFMADCVIDVENLDITSDID